MLCLDNLQNPFPIAMVQTNYGLKKSRSSNVMKVQQPESQTSHFCDTVQSYKCFAYLPVINAASSYLIPDAKHWQNIWRWLELRHWELPCLPFQSIARTRSYQYRRIAHISSWNQRLENLCCPDLVKKLNFCQAAKTQTMWRPADLSTLQADLLQFVH